MMLGSEKSMEEVLVKSREASVLAIDTEFVWENTYYPKLGVVQLGFSRDDVYLLDAFDSFSMKILGQILNDSKVTKILHDAQQDLVILSRETGSLPKNIYDTRYAAGFSGNKSTISLRDLILNTLAVEIPKTESRTNWLKRPLTDEQIEYALDDVKYLVEIREIQTDFAAKQKTLDWLNSDLEFYNNENLYNESNSSQFKKIKGVNTLESREMAIIKELSQLRDEEAKKLDRPRGWIVPDYQLINIAQNIPTSENDCSSIKGGWGKSPEKTFVKIKEIVEKVDSISPDEWPKPSKMHPKEKLITRKIKTIRSYIKEKADLYSIDPQLIATRSDIRNLIIKPGKKQTLNSGWRFDILGEELLNLANLD